MDLADPRVDANIAACERGLKRLLHTAAPTFSCTPSNGHGVWEAVIENLAAPGAGGAGARHRALLANRGRCRPRRWAAASCARRGARAGRSMPRRSSRRCATTARTRSRPCSRCTPTPPAASPATSPALRRAIDAAGHPALLVADVVASLGAAPFAMDALGVDVAVGASQKGLMCPPGVGFVAVNGSAFAAAERNPAPRFYWDWVRRKDDAVVPQVLRHAAAEPAVRPGGRAAV